MRKEIVILLILALVAWGVLLISCSSGIEFDVDHKPRKGHHKVHKSNSGFSKSRR